jgi:hypothetical protein
MRFDVIAAALGVFETMPVFSDLVLIETYSMLYGPNNTTQLWVRTIYNSSVIQVCVL